MGRSRDFAKVHFLRIASIGALRCERLLSAHLCLVATYQREVTARTLRPENSNI
jgi:hypothetical protein